MSEPFLGEIRMVGFSYAPAGWAFCQGQLVSIAQNSALFALLGVTFGGDGQTTFGLPDFRGRAPLGMGAGPGLTPVLQGQKGGSENVTLSTPQMPQHTHVPQLSANVAVPASTQNGAAKTPSSSSVLSTTSDSVAGAEVDLYSTNTPDTTLAPFAAAVTGSLGTAGGSQPVSIRSPYLGTNFIIAMEGLFPPHQ